MLLIGYIVRMLVGISNQWFCERVFLCISFVDIQVTNLQNVDIQIDNKNEDINQPHLAQPARMAALCSGHRLFQQNWRSWVQISPRWKVF
jgi:hypothetical protein